MMPRMALRRVLAVIVAACALATSGGPALARPIGGSTTPSPSPRPSVSGEVSGSTTAGATLTIRVDAAMPGGWRGLHRVDVALLASGKVIEQLTYDIENNRLGIDGHEIFLGTAGQVEGRYLLVSGVDVIVTTGGIHLSTTIPARVSRTLPDGTRFRLSVTEDHGTTAAVSRDLATSRSEGFGWGTVVALIAVALFAGAFVGNLVASRRRPPPRLSVYAEIQRRIDASAGPAGRTP
jgi:hypothetical protein